MLNEVDQTSKRIMLLGAIPLDYIIAGTTLNQWYEAHRWGLQALFEGRWPTHDHLGHAMRTTILPFSLSDPAAIPL